MKETLMEVAGSGESGLGVLGREVQPPSQRVFFCVWAVEAAVNRGGFSLYFITAQAGTVAFVAEALEAIGAPRMASICRRAIECAFPDGLPPAPGGISSGVAALPAASLEDLAELGAEFCDYPEDLTRLLCAYVMAHADDFKTLPEMGW